MTTPGEWLATIDNEQQRERMREILDWVSSTFPQLLFQIKWKQPMFTDHGTFILGFSAAAKHISISPEEAGISQFETAIEAAGYTHTPNLFRINNHQPVDYALLKQIIDYNIDDKQNVTSFWR